MITYALTKYSADASRVYVTGGSSGGMSFFKIVIGKKHETLQNERRDILLRE